MKKYFCVIALVSFISGCATTEGYKQVVNSWVGSPEINLIRSWGAPQQSYESGGTKFLIYNSARNVYLSGSSPTYTTTVIGNTAYTNSHGGSPAQNLNFSCQTTFEVQNGTIMSWSFKGNDCKAKPTKTRTSSNNYDKNIAPSSNYDNEKWKPCLLPSEQLVHTEPFRCEANGGKILK